MDTISNSVHPERPVGCTILAKFQRIQSVRIKFLLSGAHLRVVGTTRFEGDEIV